ncbi:pentapeptide repeat-containing protein [Actinophytocola glycyrrhizae]|uniref:Pentapeptide repeat-containing protein n=1 Tax=Actinophytocola glycyrrhizae TaxID=2044873 RepID=A0ABV9SB29_9PSEU
MAVTLLIAGSVAIIGGIVVFAVSSRLVATMLLAFGALTAVTGWLLPVSSRADALKTGGLAAGAVVALYALWLNDRRRRVDEERQQLEHDRQALENARADHERERAADDRFLRAVEMLGHDTDQVRVGALHALAGVARARPAYTQDVVDVLCSYLRRPFDHPEYREARGDGPRKDADPAEADRWRVVRLTAQRLLADLLPRTGTRDAPAYDLDLTGATLEFCDLSYRVIGKLSARALKMYQSNSFHHCEIRGPAWFTESRSWGNLWLHHMEFHDRAWFSKVRTFSKLSFEATVFRQKTKFENATFSGETSFADTVFTEEADFTHTEFTGALKPPPGWQRNQSGRLVRMPA